MSSWMRSALAVLMGFVTFFAVSMMVTLGLVGVTSLLAKTFTTGFGAAFLGILIAAVLGMFVALGVSSFVTAWFAQRAPYTHSTIVVALVWLVLQWRGDHHHPESILNLWHGNFPVGILVPGMLVFALGTWLGSRSGESSSRTDPIADDETVG